MGRRKELGVADSKSMIEVILDYVAPDEEKANHATPRRNVTSAISQMPVCFETTSFSLARVA